MQTVFKIFFRSEGTRPMLVLFCLILGGIAEALSISTLLPAATSIVGGETAGSSSLNKTIRGIVEFAGIAPTLENLILVVVTLMIVKSLLSFATLAYAGISAARVSNALRRRLIMAIFEARWSFYAEQSGGRFANAISNDAGRAGDAYIQAAQFISYSVQVMAYAAVGLLIDFRVAIAGLLIGSLVALVLTKLVRITRRAGFKQTDSTSGLTIYMVDMLNNIKPLKTMERYDSMMNAMKSLLKKLKRTLVTRELSRNGMNQASDALLAIVVSIGLYFAHTKLQLPLPELALSGFVFLQILNSIAKLQKFAVISAQVESAYVRTIELIKLAEQQRENKTGTLRPNIGKACRLVDVSFSHGTTPVLRNVSLDIPARAITVLSGPSGAGKTTIIDMLIGLNLPKGGDILIGRNSIGDIDISAWRRMIGYVPQELSLLHASIRANITLGDESITDEQIHHAMELAGATSFLQSLPGGLDTDVGEMGGKLSGGQRQRISLARALVTKPQVVILDEVTSALDPETEAEIVDNIAALRGAFTIIAITHRPVWTKIADRLYKVSHGKVTYIPPHVEGGSRAAPAARKKARK